jgi:hypothetical protein
VVCCVRLLLLHRFLAWQAFGLHDRLAQLDFVRIWPAEVDIRGQRQPDRVSPWAYWICWKVSGVKSGVLVNISRKSVAAASY